MSVSTSTTEDRSSTPTAESAGGATALVRPSYPDRGQSPNGLEVRGRGDRSSTFPAAIARHGDFAPTSTVSGTSCRGHRPLALSGVTRAEGDAAIASRACKARERKGRATPGFREEARRSPTRGTFHHAAVRERTEAQAVQTSCPAAGRRLFHRRDFRAGDARAESDGSANRSGRPANRARTD